MPAAQSGAHSAAREDDALITVLELEVGESILGHEADESLQEGKAHRAGAESFMILSAGALGEGRFCGSGPA
jgi:hypothetical protein